MKKVVILLSLGIFAFSLLGCRQGRKDLTIDTIKWETVTYEDIVSPEDTSYGTMTIRYDVDFPVGGLSKDVMKTIKGEIISLCIDESLSDKSPREAMKIAADSLRKDYLLTAEDLLATGFLHENMLAWNYEVNASQLRVVGNVLSYFAYVSSYSGGAHGIYYDLYLNLDATTGHPITLSDVFIDPSSEELKASITAKAARDERTFEDLSLTGNAAVEPSSQFELTNDGIIFIYEPYEIGSYAAGVIDLKFSYYELQNLLKPGFLEKYKIIAADPNVAPDAATAPYVGNSRDL
ncbi:MAG: DUF3298 and DUF4163 domain-containing protein [Bacteroidales bacterium]|nr:DUF3298 and DUF4163 domain-containing protein [Bacteroidales bacterium]